MPISLVFFASGIMLGSYRGGPLDDDTFFVLMALFWQVLASVVKGCILVCQERAKVSCTTLMNAPSVLQLPELLAAETQLQILRLYTFQFVLVRSACLLCVQLLSGAAIADLLPPDVDALL